MKITQETFLPTAGKPWTESIDQSIGCQICRGKGRQPRFNAQVALHNYVNKIIRDTVPQTNLLGNIEITVIRVFFIFITSLFSQANDWSFLTAFPCRKRAKIGIFPVTLFQASRRLKIWWGKKTSLYLTDTITSPLANHIKDGKNKL